MLRIGQVPGRTVRRLHVTHIKTAGIHMLLVSLGIAGFFALTGRAQQQMDPAYSRARRVQSAPHERRVRTREHKGSGVRGNQQLSVEQSSVGLRRTAATLEGSAPGARQLGGEQSTPRQSPALKDRNGGARTASKTKPTKRAPIIYGLAPRIAWASGMAQQNSAS